MASAEVRNGMRSHSFFEKKVTSFPGLVQEVDLLDLDSGIRTFGEYEGRKRQFVFVTRSPHDSYVLMVYESSGKPSKRVPGRRLMVKEFPTTEELTAFMKEILSKPIEAFVY